MLKKFTCYSVAVIMDNVNLSYSIIFSNMFVRIIIITIILLLLLFL